MSWFNLLLVVRLFYSVLYVLFLVSPIRKWVSKFYDPDKRKENKLFIQWFEIGLMILFISPLDYLLIKTLIVLFSSMLPWTIFVPIISGTIYPLITSKLWRKSLRKVMWWYRMGGIGYEKIPALKSEYEDFMRID